MKITFAKTQKLIKDRKKLTPPVAEINSFKPDCKVSDRVKGLFATACEKRPEIPYEFGMNTAVTEEEALIIRQVYKELQLEELVAQELELDLDIVDKAVTGEIWPYSGGALKRIPVNGPHFDNCFSANQTRFIRGVTFLAVEYFTEEELEIYCRMVSVSLKYCKLIRKKVEVDNGNRRFKRIRKVLLLTAQGFSTEEAIKSVRSQRNPSRSYTTSLLGPEE